MENNSFINNDQSAILNSLVEKALNGVNDSDRHGITLFSIALASRAKNYIELGVRHGDTSLPLLLAAHLNRGILYSVDTNETTFSPPDYLKNHWKFFQKDALDFLCGWEENVGGRVDFIYIDDWHSYDHVKKGLELVDKYVGPGSIILLHDLMYGNTEPFYHADLAIKDGQWGNGGPYRAVCELNQNFWEFSTLPWSNGLTILRKKYSSKYHTK